MNRKRMLILTGLFFVLLFPIPLLAQTYNSGSTGADGAFSPTVDTTLAIPPDGILILQPLPSPQGSPSPLRQTSQIPL